MSETIYVNYCVFLSMQPELSNSINSPSWILSLLPTRLPGEVRKVFTSNNGSQRIHITPLVNVPLTSGEQVESFIAFNSRDQFEQGDFISFEWESLGQRGYNKFKEEYGDPRAISLALISEAEADNLAKEIRQIISEDVRLRLEKQEKEILKRHQEIDNIVNEKVKDKLNEINKFAHELKEQETRFKTEKDFFLAQIEQKELQLHEEYQEKQRLLDQHKNELQCIANSIKQQKEEAEKLIQSVEPYRLAVPRETKPETVLSTEVRTFPDKLASQWRNVLTSNGLILPEALSVSYLVSLLSAFFSGSLVLLNGPVGVGKTSIVKESAKLLGGRSEVIPVRPAWLDPTDLFGFFDPIKEVFRPSPFLNALKNAEDTPERLNLICLDELNLARIENYGADLLSVLEYSCPNYTNKEEIGKKQGLLLYSESIETELWREAKYLNEKPNRSNEEQQRLEQLQAMLNSYLSKFNLSSNIAILGTLNSDETTYDLSPKVIDRAYVISYPSADLAPILNIEATSTNPNMQQSFSLSVSILANEISLRLKRLSQPDLINQPEQEEFIQGLATSWEKVLRWNKSFSGLGIPLGHRASRDFKVIYAVCNLLSLSSKDCLGYFLFTKLLPRVSFFKGPGRVDQYDQWLSTLRQDFNDLEAKLDDYDPGDILEQIQTQVEDIRRQHVRYWVRT
jgi:hypothetical protein